MHYLLTIGCLLLAAYANGTLFFDDGTVYNPCKTNPDVYFYPHPTDTHKYYQCDASGNAFERECGESLVWDPLGTACSWPTKSIYVPPKVVSTESTTWPTTTITLPPTTTTAETTTTTVLPVVSLCQPLNPCGEHGVCLESSVSVTRLSRRFACICSDKWFGRLCDKNIDSLTTSTPPMMDIDPFKNVLEKVNNFQLPAVADKDLKDMIYGLNYGNNLPVRDQLQRSKSDSNIEVTTPFKRLA